MSAVENLEHGALRNLACLATENNVIVSPVFLSMLPKLSTMSPNMMT